MFVVNGKGSLVRLIAGIFVLGSAILEYTEILSGAIFFTMFVGAMLMISALTGFCPMELILKGFKVKEKEVQ